MLVYIRFCLRICVYVCVSVCVRDYMVALMGVCLCLFVNFREWLCMIVCVCVCLCMCLCGCVCLRTCVCLGLVVHVWFFSVFAYVCV